MKLYAFLDKKPVIFDTEDIAEMFAYDGLLITLKDGAAKEAFGAGTGLLTAGTESIPPGAAAG